MILFQRMYSIIDFGEGIKTFVTQQFFKWEFEPSRESASSHKMSSLMDWQICNFFSFSAKNYKAADYAGEVKNGKIKVKKV